MLIFNIHSERHHSARISMHRKVQNDHQRPRPGEMDHYTLHVQIGTSRLILVVSETNHFGNTFLNSETIDMITVNMV